MIITDFGRRTETRNMMSKLWWLKLECHSGAQSLVRNIKQRARNVRVKYTIIFWILKKNNFSRSWFWYYIISIKFAVLLPVICCLRQLARNLWCLSNLLHLLHKLSFHLTLYWQHMLHMLHINLLCLVWLVCVWTSSKPVAFCRVDRNLDSILLL